MTDKQTAENIIVSSLRRMARDAERYRWLRAGNAYAPEEACARGGEDLDEVCDDGIAVWIKTTGSRP